VNPAGNLAPGQSATKYPDGSGIRMDAGDLIVVQIHYHYTHNAPPDQSRFVMELAKGNLDPVKIQTYLAPAEIPCSTSESGPLCDRNAVLAQLTQQFGPTAPLIANGLMAVCRKSLDDFAAMTTGVASSSCDHRIGADGDLLGVVGHEHQLGKSFRMTLNPGTPDEKVLLDTSGHRELAHLLAGVFASQVEGGKRYDLAEEGRRRANATLFEPRALDQAEELSIAMDLTPLVHNHDLDPVAYVGAAIDRLRHDVTTALRQYFPSSA
jgi:hypothetical protein